MYSSEITDVYARILATYFVQLIMGLVVVGIFYYFSYTYNRKFLRTWAWSWLAFAFHMAGLFLTTQLLLKGAGSRISYTLLAQMGAFLHVLFLLAGTYEYINKRIIPIRKYAIFISVTVALAILSVVIWHADPAAYNYRYALRLGLRTFLAASGFLVTALIVWTNKAFARSFGQKMLAVVFVLYSFDQFFYLSIILLNLVGPGPEIPSFFGIIDLLLISLIGLAMILWLLEDEREKLKIANKELDSFLYSTSHDLRAPLASILGIANLSKYDVTDEKAKNMLSMIEERAKKMDLVISDILNLAKSKKSELKIENIDFGKVLKEMLNDVKFSKGPSNIRLIYHESKLHWFYSDYNQLKIILGNLLSNAIKYHNTGQDDPYIKVDFTKDDKRCLISVEDNGQGIPKESQSRIFEMFYRASLSQDGTGLGLYITREAVTKLGGEISFISEEGKGTRFIVLLPLMKVYS
jgi:signal transduction histidine kinase